MSQQELLKKVISWVKELEVESLWEELLKQGQLL